MTERLMPGVVYMDHGARCDWIIPGELDRGGAINLISPAGTISKNCAGQATSGYLVEVERVKMQQMEEWRQQYPEAFRKSMTRLPGCVLTPGLKVVLSKVICGIKGMRKRFSYQKLDGRMFVKMG